MKKLDGRTRELIAVGAAVTANCQPCLRFHAGAALKEGAEVRDIHEAIAIGKLVRKGAAEKFDKAAVDWTAGNPAADSATDKECGCGG